MKIALCFYGQPRSVSSGYDYFKKYLLDIYDVDVHAHIWHTDGVTEFEKLYQPKSILIEDQINFKIPDGVFGIEPKHGESAYTRHAFNSISQAYSFYQSCLTRLAYETNTSTVYDLVIKARTDTTIYSLNIDSVNSSCYNVPSIPDGFIYNDVLAICSPNIADIVGFKYNKLDQWYAEGIRDYIPESLNSRVLLENNIQIKQLDNTHINLTGY